MRDPQLHGRDWFQLLDDLERAGVSNAEVARQLNVARWKVGDWKQGFEPTYYYGDKLVTLHAKYCLFVAQQRPLETDIAL